MSLNLTEKIIKAHLVEGQLVPGETVKLKIDQTLTQDSTGTMAYLQLEAMGIDRVKTDLSVAYVDHNMLQVGFENADDHKYIQTVAAKYGIHFSRPGNGICHQVHLERFGVVGATLIGSDSHTPTAGGLGMLAIGAGGLDVAAAMSGEPYALAMPEVVNIRLTGKLRPFVTAKDVILEVLRRLSVKGGVGKVMEYSGDGVRALSVPERSTITNMGAELGATTSIFPSDQVTKQFLEAQGRGGDWRELAGDPGCSYAKVVEIDLATLEPLVAKPHSPDNVASVASLGKLPVDQVAIGSCTNSSYQDLMKVAAILQGETVHPDVSLVISPGSKQVLTMLAENGALANLIAAGARILESGCGPCIGMGQAPATKGISLRTFNRNFQGRCGTSSADVYLVSPETAALSAIAGKLVDPLACQKEISISAPQAFPANDNMMIPPAADSSSVTVVRGPNIHPFPLNSALPSEIKAKVLIKVEDNITTDHIMPSNAKLLPYRSNIPYLANHCLAPCNPDFPERAREHNGGVIVGGENYGQGSSREHAALVPLYLGIKAVLAKSFARIHRSNLINSGIIPLTFTDSQDYSSVAEFDELVVKDVRAQLKAGSHLMIDNLTKGIQYKVECKLAPQELAMILAGGKINLIKQKAIKEIAVSWEN